MKQEDNGGRRWLLAIAVFKVVKGILAVALATGAFALVGEGRGLPLTRPGCPPDSSCPTSGTASDPRGRPAGSGRRHGIWNASARPSVREMSEQRTGLAFRSSGPAPYPVVGESVTDQAGA